MRVCVDYLNLNSIMKKRAYPLSIMTDVRNIFKGSKYYSIIDLKTGYWQIPLSAKDKEKTAFSFGPEYGLFEFNVMPFGLTGGPGTCQRMMNRILKGIPYAFVYLDDILVFSETYELHEIHLEKVFSKSSSAGLTINAKKSIFGAKNIKYLGYVFDENGMTVDEKKSY